MIGFVVNPESGNGRGRKNWQSIASALNEQGVAYQVQFTQAPLDAERYAAEYASDPSIHTIAAVGGDGTVHEAAGGLYQAGCTKPLGYIPAGSGNDFARGFGIPSRTEEALALLLKSRKTLAADIIRCDKQIAVCSIGAGFDGKVARVTNTAPYKKWLNKIKLGKLSYVLSLIRVLLSYKPCQVTVTADGASHRFEQVWLIATANIPHYGGGMMICPDADPSDGSATVCIVSGIGKLELLTVFPRVYKGTHITHPAVRFLHGRKIAIQSERPLDIHMDGEAAGTTPANLEVVPAALSVIVS